RRELPSRRLVDRPFQRGGVLVISQARARARRPPGRHVWRGGVSTAYQHVIGDRGLRLLCLHVIVIVIVFVVLGVVGVLGHQLDTDRRHQRGGVDLTLRRFR